MTQTPAPEWSHKTDVTDIGDVPVRKTMTASPQQRKDLARRLDVESLDRVEARLVITRTDGNRLLHVAGTLEASVTQLCVVTLDPVSSDISCEIEGWFAEENHIVSIAKARHERQSRKADAEVEMLDERDDPEAIIDGHIDLGELVSQHLMLALDPYPHKEGVVLEDIAPSVAGGGTPEKRVNPFAALKDWKKDR